MAKSNQIWSFNALAKPTGPDCNLNCSYCYYKNKKQLYPFTTDFRMTDDTLELFTMKYISQQPAPEINFEWQGGEPTLLGTDYFRKALKLQEKYAAGKRIYNSFQTNGVLLNDEWCSFFKENDFLIGISIDGPEEIHNSARTNKGGQGTFSSVMRGINLLKKYNIDFNTLTVVSSLNVEKPREVYNFLKSIGSNYMQFIPIVEQLRCMSDWEDKYTDDLYTKNNLSPFSVDPEKYGRFLIKIFNEWVAKDVGKHFVQIFDVTLANELGLSPGLCIFDEYCGNALAVEHNGDVFSCDHYVTNTYKLGNIHHSNFNNMLFSVRQQQFGLNKFNSLPDACRKCSYYQYCKGECPKNRIIDVNQGEKKLNYLCKSYKLFFEHVKPYMEYMAEELQNQRPPANIMFKELEKIALMKG